MADKHLIIGGAGFIGSHLVEKILLADELATVTVFDNLSMGNNESEIAAESSRVDLRIGDASEPIQLLKLIEALRPNKIWHLAANSDISKSAHSSGIDVESTFATTAALCLVISQISRPLESIVFASSSAIFGEHLEKIREDSAKNPESAYGWMKLASERLLRSLFSSGLVGKGLIARFPNVTGQRQTHGVVKDLVAKYFSLEQPWLILGDGFQDKPYLHVRELTEILIAVESGLAKGEFFELNISPDTSATVRSIVETIEAIARKGRIPIYGETAYGWIGDIPKYKFDNSMLSRLGFSASSSQDAISISVKEEIKKYLE